MDGIDVAIVKFVKDRPHLLHTQLYPFETSVTEQIQRLCLPGNDEIDQMGELDVLLGYRFAEAALDAIKQASLSQQQIAAIGSHGQTIRHRPSYTHPFTLQIGDPNTIAYQSGITTVADFRRRDMSAGGQGAPLAPAFHHFMFRSEKADRAIINVGGISNMTWLAQQGHTFGFDVGPGNTLMDAWTQLHLSQPFDEHGAWASTGKVDSMLLEKMHSHPFLEQQGPKSTGREEFSLEWLSEELKHFPTIRPEDVQRSLCQFSVDCIAKQINALDPNCEIYICGGGARNSFFIAQLNHALPDCKIATTEALGIHPDWVEASAFAWLARQTLNHKPGNLPSVTGATLPVILGGVYHA